MNKKRRAANLDSTEVYIKLGFGQEYQKGDHHLDSTKVYIKYKAIRCGRCTTNCI